MTLFIILSEILFITILQSVNLICVVGLYKKWKSLCVLSDIKFIKYEYGNALIECKLCFDASYIENVNDNYMHRNAGIYINKYELYQ